jgi:hypothetical protein
MLTDHLKITADERNFLEKWVEICSNVLGKDESWEDGVLLKGLNRRMKQEGYTPTFLDIKQWYTTTLVSQDLLEYQDQPHDTEKEKLTKLCSKLNGLLEHFVYGRNNEV